MPYVAVFLPGREPLRHELRPINIFGRSSGCDVWVDDRNVSRRHCKLERAGERWMLFDLGSTNGTWLDAARVRRYALRDGETFYIGDARIIFHADQWIENRPADPHEALSVSKIYKASDTLADTHVAPDLVPGRAQRTLPHARVTVVRRGELRRSAPAKALAFQRPPAMPMVHAPPPKNWVHTVLSTLRR